MSTSGDELEIKSWLRGRTMIGRDFVEVARNNQTRRVTRTFLKGVRIAAGRSRTRFVLEVMNEAPLSFVVANTMAPRVRALLSGLPDLDAADLRAAEDAVRKDDAFGASPEERWKTLQDEKRTTIIINWICAGLAAWGLIYPHPYAPSVIVCGAIPIVALLLTYVKRSRWYLLAKKNDPHPTVIIGLLAGVIAISLRASLDIETFDWPALIGFSVLAGPVLAVCALLPFGGLTLRRWPSAIVGAAYAFGAIAQANTMLAQAPPQIFEAKITGREIHQGRSTTYTVALAQWGPEAGDNTHDVLSDVYDELSGVSSACVALHPGALKLRWFVIGVCGK